MSQPVRQTSFVNNASNYMNLFCTRKNIQIIFKVPTKKALVNNDTTTTTSHNQWILFILVDKMVWHCTSNSQLIFTYARNERN